MSRPRFPQRWWKHWHDRQSTHGLIARSFTLVAVYVLISKLAGASKEILSARSFGTSTDMDAFVFILNFASWPASVALPLLSALLVPLYVQLNEPGAESIRRFRGEVHGLVLLTGVALGVLFALLPILNPTLMTSAGLSAASTGSMLELLWILAALVPVGLYGSLLSAESLARRRHLNTLLEGVPALIVSAFLLINTGASIVFLAWATLAGLVCQAMLLHAEQMRHCERPDVRLGFSSPHWKTIRHGLLAMVLAQTLQSLTNLIDQLWAARLGEGAVSTMGYAQRLVFLLLGLGMTAIGRATLPVFSRLVADNGTGQERIAIQWSVLLAGLGIAILAVAWPFTPWLISLLFERGAFTPADTQATASFVRHSLLQLPFYLPGIVLVQWLLATRRYQAMTWLACVNLLTKALANYLFVPAFGLDGLALASSAMYAINTLVLIVYLQTRRRHP